MVDRVVQKVTSFNFNIKDFETYMKAQAGIGPGQSNVSIEWGIANLNDIGNSPIACVVIRE